MVLVVLRSYCGGVRCPISGCAAAGGVKVAPTGAATGAHWQPPRGCDAAAASALQPLTPGGVRWIAASGLGVGRRAESERENPGEAGAPPMPMGADAVVCFVEPGGAFPSSQSADNAATRCTGQRTRSSRAEGSQVNARGGPVCRYGR